MKVKIGKKIYDSEDQPIMLVLSDQEKNLISLMKHPCHKFCEFPEGLDEKMVRKFMEVSA